MRNIKKIENSKTHTFVPEVGDVLTFTHITDLEARLNKDTDLLFLPSNREHQSLLTVDMWHDQQARERSRYLLFRLCDTGEIQGRVTSAPKFDSPPVGWFYIGMEWLTPVPKSRG